MLKSLALIIPSKSNSVNLRALNTQERECRKRRKISQSLKKKCVADWNVWSISRLLVYSPRKIFSVCLKFPLLYFQRPVVLKTNFYLLICLFCVIVYTRFFSVCRPVNVRTIIRISSSLCWREVVGYRLHTLSHKARRICKCRYKSSDFPIILIIFSEFSNRTFFGKFAYFYLFLDNFCKSTEMERWKHVNSSFTFASVAFLLFLFCISKFYEVSGFK